MQTQTIENSIPTGEGLTFEKVWAALMETRDQMKETDLRLDKQFKETDRQFKETDLRLDKQFKETDLRLDKQFKETDLRLNQRFKETERLIGKLGNRFGELVEHLIIPNIVEKFNLLGFHFNKFSENIVIYESGNACAEIDILLENGDFVIAIEVKAKPNSDDINEHIKRMQILRRMARHNDTRKYQGAIAGAVMNTSVRNYAVKAGFYPIEQSGDTIQITVPQGFKPREW
jgi:hypothetical protein